MSIGYKTGFHRFSHILCCTHFHTTKIITTYVELYKEEEHVTAVEEQMAEVVLQHNKYHDNPIPPTTQ